MGGAALVGLASCDRGKFEGFTTSETGLYYQFFNHDEKAQKVQKGDLVTIGYRISKQSNDSVIMESKRVSREGSGYTKHILDKIAFKGSFEDGMLMMNKGDSAAFIISADSFFLKNVGANELPKGFKPGDYLKGIFVVKDVVPSAEVEKMRQKEMAEREAMMREMQGREQGDLEKFIAEKKITVKPTASGLYYIETKKGTGPSPSASDFVKVHYTGRFLDGRIFDSSVQRGQPAEFALTQVIPGWTEALQLMKKGGKANLLVPSSIGYGPQGRGDIPPFTPMYFEVELIDIQAVQAGGNTMPPQNK